MGRIPFGPDGLRAVEIQLAVLRTAGIPDQIAADAGDLIGSYIVAGVVEDDMWRTRFPDADAADVTRQMDEVRDYLRSLPADRLPNVVALAEPMRNHEAEGFDRFELGLEVILRGIASFAQPTGGAADVAALPPQDEPPRPGAPAR